MKTIKTYECFNQRRYSNPWVAIVGEDGKINFNWKIGGYTGAYGKGEAGELYITEPVENAVYAYGQKDYRGNNTEYRYIQYRNGQFVPVEKTELIAVLNGAAPEAAAEEEAVVEEAVEETTEPEDEIVEEAAEEAAPETVETADAEAEKAKKQGGLTMKAKLYAHLMLDAENISDRDAYVSDWVLSSVWGAPIPDDEWVQLIDMLGHMWDAAHLTIKDIRAAAGMSQSVFADHLVASLRTVQSWEYGRNKCPLFVRLILAERFGLYQPPEVE